MKRDLNSVTLTRGETEVMRAVWKLGGGTVRSIYNAQSPRKPFSYPSVTKLARTLEAKGCLIHVKTGRAYYYMPVLSFHRAKINHLRDLIDRYFDGDSQKLIEWMFVNMQRGGDPATMEDSILPPPPVVRDMSPAA